jgi:hypothetical protein
MGLLKQVANIFELIYDEGEKEWLDEEKYKEALDTLYTKLENGEISENEYDEQEAEILSELKEVRKYKKEHEINEN